MPVPSYQYIYSDDIPTSSELEIAATATDGHPTTFYVLSSDANRKTYETRDLYRERLQTACDQVLEWPAVSCGGGPLLTDEAKALKRNLADGKITMAEYCNTEKTLQSIDEFSKGYEWKWGFHKGLKKVADRESTAGPRRIGSAPRCSGSLE